LKLSPLDRSWMKKLISRRLITELLVTAVASPLLLFLMVAKAYGVFSFLLSPVFSFADEIASWTSTEFPGGGWFEGLHDRLVVGVILVLVEIWIVLMIVVRLAGRFILRRRTV
jgi:hypothetical protein